MRENLFFVKGELGLMVFFFYYINDLLYDLFEYFVILNFDWNLVCFFLLDFFIRG